MRLRTKKALPKRLLAAAIIIALFFSCWYGVAHVQGRSGGSMGVESVFRIVLVQKRAQTDKAIAKELAKARETNSAYRVPSFYKGFYGFDVETFEGNDVCVFNPGGAKTVYYLHGGAYIFQPLLTHYRYCNILAKQFDARVIMPIYPKAPNWTYRETVGMVYRLYMQILQDTDSGNIVFMGDSAGGGLVLALSEYLTEMGAAQPSSLVMFSPWLDGALDNAEIDGLIKDDPMLDAKALREQMRLYSDGDVENYLVSPINGNLSNLPPMLMFAGTHEILVADCRVFAKRAAAQEVAMDYREYPYMNHTFCIFPIPEAAECRKIIAEKTILGD